MFIALLANLRLPVFKAQHAAATHPLQRKRYPSFLRACRWAFITTTIACAAPSYAMDKVLFQLDWLPGGDKAPVYVGIEQGFFKAENIDVKVMSGRGSTESITKVATGRAQLGLTDITALLAAKSNSEIPATAIYNIFSEAAHAFFTLEASHIKAVTDLPGKKIATSPFTSSNVFLPLLLAENNLHEKQIKLIKSDPGALNPMLLNGSVDAIISWLTDAQKYQAQANKAGKTLRVIPWSSAGLSIYSTSIIANDEFLKQNPELAKRFLKAYRKAVAYTWAHPQISGENVHQQIPEVDAAQAASTIESIYSLVYNEASAADGLGQFNPERLQKTWDITAKAQNLTAKNFDPETAVDRRFMPEGE